MLKKVTNTALIFVWLVFSMVSLTIETTGRTGCTEISRSNKAKNTADNDCCASDDCEVFEESEETEEVFWHKTICPLQGCEIAAVIHNLIVHNKLSGRQRSTIGRDIPPILQICQRTIVLLV